MDKVQEVDSWGDMGDRAMWKRSPSPFRWFIVNSSSWARHGTLYYWATVIFGNDEFLPIDSWLDSSFWNFHGTLYAPLVCCVSHKLTSGWLCSKAIFEVRSANTDQWSIFANCEFVHGCVQNWPAVNFCDLSFLHFCSTWFIRNVTSWNLHGTVCVPTHI